jgi:serine/threonine protein kinase
MSSYLPIGTILDSNYRILELIGQGGFGITYKAENISLGNIVCIKELFISGNSTRGANNTVHSQNMKENSFNYFKERFITEARDLAKFNNPGIVKVTRVFEQNDTAYFVMDFVEGETLKNYVSKNGRLTIKAALPIMDGLMNALEYVHNKGMLHRDIKPDNVLIDKNGNVVLIDFGSARQFTEGYTVTHTSMITPGYAPLEQYDERVKRGAFTDIYSLGATMYFLLTGQKPIPATSRSIETLEAPHNLYSDISVSLSSAVMLAMNLKPQDRFQTIAELREALQSQLDANNSESTKTNSVEDIGKKTLISQPEEIINPTKVTEEIGKSNSTPKVKNYNFLVFSLLGVVLFLIFMGLLGRTKSSEIDIPKIVIPTTDSIGNLDEQLNTANQNTEDLMSVYPSDIIGEIKVLGDLEITQCNFQNSMTWSQANEACAALGDGWRLPTKDELNLMYEKKDDIKVFANSCYWSSSGVDNNYAWVQNFYNSDISLKPIEEKWFVRAVRNFNRSAEEVAK